MHSEQGVTRSSSMLLETLLGLVAHIGRLAVCLIERATAAAPGMASMLISNGGGNRLPLKSLEDGGRVLAEMEVLTSEPCPLLARQDARRGCR